ncbi:MAG: S8 family serine peptidase [Candidatus Zixiibacteriota bacterium]
MNSYIRTTVKISFTVIILILLSLPMAGAQGDPFFGCGMIFADSGCAVLVLNMGQEFYAIDSTAGLGTGDWACIYGEYVTPCDTSCLGATVCISVDSIIPQPTMDTLYGSCGILIQSTNCLLLAPLSGPIVYDSFYLALENYGQFGLYDTVCVSGNLFMESPPSCPEADAWLAANTIQRWSPPNTPFNDCGILTEVGGCLLFDPLSTTAVYYYLDNYGGYGIGDTVCVAGTLISNCDSGCVESDGCIAGNSIYAWSDGGVPYDRCGIILAGPDCVIFQALGDTLILALSDYGEFTYFDTVCISGTVDWNCDLGCTGVDGCLYTNYISLRDNFYYQNEVIIKMEEGFPIEPVLAEYAGDASDSLIFQNTYLVSFPSEFLIEQLIDSISARPGVIFAQPNYMMGVPEAFHVSQSFPDDARPPLEVGYSPPNYYTASSPYTINSDTANLFEDGEGIVIAVIDNGVNFTHPLLEESFAGTGIDFIDGDYDPSEVEGLLYGHGTFVCGIIKRIAPACRILPIRAFDENGNSNSFVVANAIQYAVAQSVDVINMSFGNYSSNPIVQEAVGDAVAAGISLIAAVGNGNTMLPTYPAAYPGVIAVNAIDSMEYRAPFSNYGDYIDVCAPGVDIYSSLAGEYEWGSWNGTSFAAPIVAGVCVLIKAQDNDIGSLAVEQMIRISAERHLDWGTVVLPNIEYGAGRVDALRPNVDLNLGDVNDNDSLNLLDIIYIINMLYKSGPPPEPIEDIGDIDCSGTINLIDVTVLINYLYRGAAKPSCLQY